jgi:predicted acylesterase/phospholipase RssA
MHARRDVAIVLSGGGINGVLMELGFLQRVRASELWQRIGWIFGTSAGAVSGTMAALDRLPQLERFLLSLRPEEAFRPNRLWRLPLLGLHDYTLPATVADRLGDPVELARDLAREEIEVVVLATDLTETSRGDGTHSFELAYSSKRTPPEEMAQAVLASAAVSALVLPLRVGERIATDGSWVRNYPLGYAYDHADVGLIVAFRYLAQYPEPSIDGLASMRRKFERFGRVPPIRAIIEQLREAEQRSARGEPAHLPEMIIRLARVAIQRNTVLEERYAGEKDVSVRELSNLREDLLRLVDEGVRSRRDRAALRAAVDERFARARFPFRHDRAVPRITVRASVNGVSLEPSFRGQQPWTEEAKRELVERGYELADAELRAAGLA